MDKGATLGKELVNFCESVNQNVQTSVTQVKDPAILKKYEALATKIISMIKEYSNLFINLSFNNRKYLNMIPDPTADPVGPASKNTSRNSSHERHHRKNHDHLKPPAM